MGGWIPSNTDPAEDGVEITGQVQPIDPPGRAIHCDVDGTLTFRLTKMAPGTSMTRTLKGGLCYSYAVAEVIAKGGTFAGAIMR